ncbi:hypothetical protein PFISCL1PPCAC_23878, partial [Pristionchus fissidentatus]
LKGREGRGRPRFPTTSKLDHSPNTEIVFSSESADDQKRRFEAECEFVQALANPHYLTFLAQRGYFKEEYFVNYLKYLLYWQRPEYARALKYPQCLHLLEALQSADFREALASSHNAKFIEDQQILQWQYYLRKRQRLHENPSAAEDVEESKEEKGKE